MEFSQSSFVLLFHGEGYYSDGAEIQTENERQPAKMVEAISNRSLFGKGIQTSSAFARLAADDHSGLLTQPIRYLGAFWHQLLAA